MVIIHANGKYMAMTPWNMVGVTMEIIVDVP